MTSGLAAGPLWLDYRPHHPTRHPWATEHPDPDDLPVLYLTDHNEDVFTDAEWQTRDTVVGFGGLEGTARFARLLLDVGHLDATRDEYVLEGEAGVRGVGPCSAELMLWLPGSIGWDPDYGLD